MIMGWIVGIAFGGWHGCRILVPSVKWPAVANWRCCVRIVRCHGCFFTLTLAINFPRYLWAYLIVVQAHALHRLALTPIPAHTLSSPSWHHHYLLSWPSSAPHPKSY